MRRIIPQSRQLGEQSFAAILALGYFEKMEYPGKSQGSQ
jgi:hypothetical protein